MLDSIGRDAYNGADLFENTEPLSNSGNNSNPHSPLSGVSPRDAGVDIEKFMGKSEKIWQEMNK